MKTLYKLEQICLLAVVHVCEDWNNCYLWGAVCKNISLKVDVS